MALLLVAAVALMVMGYRQEDPVIWLGRQASWVVVSNALVYLGFIALRARSWARVSVASFVIRN